MPYGLVVERHPADSRGLRVMGGPPGAGRPARVYDVLLVPTSDTGAYEEFRSHPPAGDPPAGLGRGLSICHLPGDLCELIMDACTLRGHYFFAQRHWGARYALVLEQPLDQAFTYRWDQENVIRDALVLGRLVRDNAYSTEFAGRVTEFDDGQLRIAPHDGAESRDVYRMHRDRDWFDAGEARQLADLLTCFWSSPELPRRLERALFVSEHVAWERYGDVVLPGLVAALEGMLSTSRHQLTRQFVTRVPALADEVGVEGISKTFCRKMYEARSQGAHGDDIDLFKAGADLDESVRKLARLQDVLRATLRRGIEDPTFRAVFENASSIRAHWTVTARHRLWRWRRVPL